MAIADSDLENLQTAVSTDLRTVFNYDRSDFEVVFVRDDLDRASMADWFAECHDELILQQRFQSELECGADPRMTMYYTTEAVGIHIPQAQYSGLLITIEPDATVDMATLQAVCLEFMY